MKKEIKVKTTVSKFLFEGQPNGGETFTEKYSEGRLVEKTHAVEPKMSENIRYEYDSDGHLIRETSVVNMRPRPTVREYKVSEVGNGIVQSRYDKREEEYVIIEYRNGNIVSREEKWGSSPDDMCFRDVFDENGETVEHLSLCKNGSLTRTETVVEGDVTTKKYCSYHIRLAGKDFKNYEMDEKPYSVITETRTTAGSSAHTIVSDESGKKLREIAEKLDDRGNVLSSVLLVEKQVKGRVLIAQQQRKEQTNTYDSEGNLVSSFIRSEFPEGHSCETSITYEY